MALFYVSGGSGGRVANRVDGTDGAGRTDEPSDASDEGAVDNNAALTASTSVGNTLDTVGSVDSDGTDYAAPYVAHLDHGAAPYRVAVTTCKECKRGWLHGAGTVSLMSPGAVEAALCDAQFIGDLDSPIVERAKQDIPPAKRRKVKHRDQGRCRIPGCRSSLNIDIHHLIPLSKGGTHDYDQLVTLCEGHHIAHHEGALDIKVDGETGEITVRREARNSFTRATRAIEAAKALRAQHFPKEAVRAAIERTKTHVGTTDMTVEQWLVIAKRYLEKSRPT